MSKVISTEDMFTNINNEVLREKVAKRVKEIEKSKKAQSSMSLNLLRACINLQTKDNNWYELVETTIVFDENNTNANTVDNISERCLRWVNNKLATYKHLINNNKVLHVCKLTRDTEPEGKLITTDDIKEVSVYFLA